MWIAIGVMHMWIDIGDMWVADMWIDIGDMLIADMWIVMYVLYHTRIYTIRVWYVPYAYGIKYAYMV